jgi:hypothetical protein
LPEAFPLGYSLLANKDFSSFAYLPGLLAAVFVLFLIADIVGIVWLSLGLTSEL